MSNPKRLSRRQFIQLSLALPAPVVLAACAPTAAPAQPSLAPTDPPAVQPAATEVPPTLTPPTEASTLAPAVLPPTPACGDAEELTLAQTEGPYYTPNTPERTSLLEEGYPGTHLVVTGQVLTTGCQPVAQALLDFWHADDSGQYDNVGFRFRGHQFADDQGRYRLETIVPGLYPGRTRHIHVKVQAPNQPVLTTQLYFPGEAQNQRDAIYQPELEMEVAAVDDGQAGAFNFVLDTA